MEREEKDGSAVSSGGWMMVTTTRTREKEIVKRGGNRPRHGELELEMEMQGPKGDQKKRASGRGRGLLRRCEVGSPPEAVIICVVAVVKKSGSQTGGRNHRR